MIKVGSALLEYAEQLERERGIPKELILDSLKEAMVAAYRKYAKLPDTQGLSCRLIEKTGEIGIYEHKLIVEEIIEPPEEEEEVASDELEEGQAPELSGADVPATTVPSPEGTTDELAPQAELAEQSDDLASPEPVEPASEEGYAETDPEAEAFEEEEEKPYYLPVRLQLKLADARKFKPDIQIGQELLIEVTPSDFGRIAAQSAKQVIMQRIREAEKYLIQQEFEQKKDTVVPAIVQRLDGPNVIVSIGRSEGVMTRKEQLPGEYYRVGNKLRVYVLELRDTGRVPQIIVSQAHAAMVREVFELEVPEIEDGLVEIKSIAREAGHRTKVAVHSPDGQVDPQGACIGTRGSRIQSIVNELRNEKIDIIRWSEYPADFIVNALAPARIADVRLDPNPDNRRALVVVPDDQLSLAIGREGQNVRLAAKLTGYKLDIKSISQFQHLRDKLVERQQQRDLEGQEPPLDSEIVDAPALVAADALEADILALEVDPLEVPVEEALPETVAEAIEEHLAEDVPATGSLTQ